MSKASAYAHVREGGKREVGPKTQDPSREGGALHRPYKGLLYGPYAWPPSLGLGLELGLRLALQSAVRSLQLVTRTRTKGRR
jgi:hypothetical protein